MMPIYSLSDMFEKHLMKMIENRNPSELESTGMMSECVETSRIKGVEGE